MSASTSTSTTTTTLAILAGTSTLASAAHNSNVRASRPAAAVVAEAQDVNKHHPSLGKECNTFNNVKTTTSNTAEWVSNEEKKANVQQEEADVGILLVGCTDKDLSCTPDDSSSLGGRCHTTTSTDINYNNGEEDTQPSTSTEHSSIKKTSRILYLTPDLFGPNPLGYDLCYCIQYFTDEFPSDGCANKVNQVCTNGNVLSEYYSECDVTAGDGYGQFITDVLCPYAQCLGDNESTDECYCEYYSNYCDAYPTSNEDFCNIADCCEDKPIGQKAECWEDPAPGPGPNPPPTKMPTRPPTPQPTSRPTPRPTDKPKKKKKRGKAGKGKKGKKKIGGRKKKQKKGIFD